MKHLAALFLGCLAVLQPALAQPIVIGQSVPLSGRNADIGRDMRDGALAVFNQANASNALGRPIQLVTLDNANSGPRAVENTEQLLKQDALLLFGYNSATTSMDSLPLAVKAKAVFFAPFSGSSALRDNPNVYTVRASYRDEAMKIAESKRVMGAERAVVLHYDDEVGRANYDAVASAFVALGAPKPPGVATKRGSKLEPKTIESLTAGDPHYVLATTQFDVVAEYLKAGGDRRKAPVAALSFVNPDELVDAVGEAGRGTVVAQVVPSPRAANQVSVPVIRECAEALNALNGEKLNYTSLESCIAAKALLVALKKAGRGVTRESLLKAMPTLGRVDLGGFVLNYGPDHRNGGNWVELTILARGNKFER